jgi:hypothetical protein
MVRNCLCWVHKDGKPTLNRDSAYEYPTIEAAKCDANKYAIHQNAVIYPIAGT